MKRPGEWYEVAADAYLDRRQRNWRAGERRGDVVVGAGRRLVLVHRQRAKHIAAALGAAEVGMVDQLLAELAATAPAQVSPAAVPCAVVQPLLAVRPYEENGRPQEWLDAAAEERARRDRRIIYVALGFLVVAATLLRLGML